MRPGGGRAERAGRRYHLPPGSGMRRARPHLLGAPRTPSHRARGEVGGAAAAPNRAGRRRGGDRSLKDATEDPLGPAGEADLAPSRQAGPGSGSCARKQECMRVNTRGCPCLDKGLDGCGSGARDGPRRG